MYVHLPYPLARVIAAESMTIPNEADANRAGEGRSKGERLEACLTRQQKELLQQATDLEGRSLTDFVVSSAQEKALRTIADHTIIKLSQEDALTFVENLLHPPEPSTKMLEAARQYKQSMGME